MKFVLGWCCLIVSLWAEKVEVLYASVTLEVNEANVTYEKDALFELDYAKKICMVGGDGILIITKKSGKEVELVFKGEKVCSSPKIADPIPDIPWYKEAWNWVFKPSVDVKKSGVSGKDFEDEK